MSTYANTDQLLLQQMAEGNEQAFCSLFDRYWNRVYASALVLARAEHLAQDIAQEVFLQLWQHREKAVSIEKLDGYLFIIARNLTLRKLSRLKMEDAYQHYLSCRIDAEARDAGETAELKELQHLVESGISCLPPQQQRAFRLSRENGLSHEEISLHMGVSRGAVKDYIVRSISFLRKYLREHALFLLALLAGMR